MNVKGKTREGDLIETFDGNIFDVKGLVHPPEKIIAFIRFTPDPKGNRKRGGVTYRKVYPLQERYELLQEKFPQYLVYDNVFDERLCEVPVAAVKRHYRPNECLRALRLKKKLTSLEATALRFAELLKETAKVRWNALGVSGSLLAGLSTSTSDIDLLVYGSQDCFKVYDALKTLVNEKDGAVKSYGVDELQRLFDFRSKDTIMSFEDFVRTESRKVLQGKFNDRDYFIRCVKERNEIKEQYGMGRYKALGYARIKAMIVDDSQMIFTPCSYRVDDVRVVGESSVKPGSIGEIVSFRGRFCEQARNGEFVVAQGKVELVQTKSGAEYCRLLLGNKVSDYMILA